MSSNEPAIYLVFGVQVEVVAIDISSIGPAVDVLASSDDNYLSHGGFQPHYGVQQVRTSSDGPEVALTSTWRSAT